jgi:hypothetical protein
MTERQNTKSLLYYFPFSGFAQNKSLAVIPLTLINKKTPPYFYDEVLLKSGGDILSQVLPKYHLR